MCKLNLNCINVITPECDIRRRFRTLSVNEALYPRKILIQVNYLNVHK